MQHINLGSRIEGLYREDIYELPIQTIREMIANAVCHRSYLSPGKIQVALFDDRLEVTSPGMLDNEITVEKMKTGLSKIRNKGIAAALSYMNVIEAWGSGVPRMFREAKEYGLPEPELMDLGSDFRVNLYRRKFDTDRYGIKNPTVQNHVNETNFSTIDTIDTIRETNDIDKEKVTALIQANPTITQMKLQKETGLSLSTVKRVMAELKKSGKVVRIGNNRSGSWQVRK